MRKRRTQSDRPRRRFNFVLLAMALVVGAVAAYVAFAPQRGAGRAPAPYRAGLPTDQEKVLASARGLMQSGQFAPARDLMNAYVHAHPEDVEVRRLLADALVQLGDAPTAEHTIDDVLRRAPDDASALWTKGVLAGQRGADAMAFFKLAAQSPSADPKIWGAYAAELLQARQFDQARQYALKARQAGLKDAGVMSVLGELALRDKDFAAAAELLTAAVDAGADIRVRGMLAEAQKLCGRLDDAAATLERALESVAGAEDQQSNARLFKLALGQVRERQELFAQAADAYAAASPYDAARCYYLAGRFALAMEQADLAADGLDDLPAPLASLRAKIEDARFGPSQPASEDHRD